MSTPPDDPIRVLIVDDHAPFRRLARELLERRGFDVVAEAFGTRDAVDAASRTTPEAALVDVRLGGEDGDGFALCRTLTLAHPRLAVVIVSSDDRLGVPDRVRESGARLRRQVAARRRRPSRAAGPRALTGFTRLG